MPSRKAEVMMLVTSLKGAPLSVMFVMLALGESFGVAELAVLTGYSRNSIKAGMETLSVLGIAQHGRRYQGWSLTNKGQMILGEREAQNLSSEAQNLRLALSSSSSISFKEEEKETTTTKTTLKEVNIDDIPLDLEGEEKELANEVYDLMVDNQVWEAVARRRLRRAIRAGIPIEDLKGEYLGWIKSLEGAQGLHKPVGVVAAAMLAKGELCPEVPKVGSEYLGQYAHLIKHQGGLDYVRLYVSSAGEYFSCAGVGSWDSIHDVSCYVSEWTS